MTPETRVMMGLMARGLPPHIAQGITANMIAESRLDPGINEIAPLVPGSRGGFGLNQWTGPRRVQYEQYARERGVPLDDIDTQLDFTLWELKNTERPAFNALQGAQSAEEAARLYSERFLRPGIPHLDRRIAEARRLAGQDMPQVYAANYEQPQGPQQPQNALAAPETRQQAPTFNPLDPRAFMANTAPNAFAGVPVEFRPNYLSRRA